MKASGSAVLAIMALITGPALAQVHVDYDRSVDFSSFKTFAWANTEAPNLAEEAPLMHSRVKNAIEYQLTTAGMREDTQRPDVFVSYSTATKEEVRMSTSHMGFGGGWGWDPYWGGGFGTSSTSVHTYDRGTLVLDIWDASSKNAIFRGTAEGTVPSNPEKAGRQIDKSIEKIVKKFDSMYRKGR